MASTPANLEVMQAEIVSEVSPEAQDSSLQVLVAASESHIQGQGAGNRAEENPAAVYLASLAPGSRRAMRQALDVVASELSGGRCDASTCSWGALRFSHAQAARSFLAARYAPATANKCLAALRGTLKAAWRLGQMPTEEYLRAVDLPSVRGQALPRGRALSMGELRALLRACTQDHTPGGARDTALLALLYNCGLRRAEAVALDLADYDARSGEVKVRSGKGRRARTVYANANTRRVLDAWAALRLGAHALDGPLFLPLVKSGRIVHRRLNDQAVMDILLKRARQAGVHNVSPHDLRRTFISDLLDAGVDTVTVQKMAGHASPATTARYDRRGEAAKQTASEVLHVPL